MIPKQASFFLLVIGGYLLSNVVLVPAIHQHESAMGLCMSPPSEPPSHLPPHPIPPDCHRAPALGFLLHNSKFPLAM